jgi:hypothetical protein
MKKRLFLIALITTVLSGLFIWNVHNKRTALLKHKPVCFADNSIYPGVCTAAANDPHEFNRFKRNCLLNLYFENETFEEGKKYLQAIKIQSPGFLTKFEQIRKNDLLGTPRQFDYGIDGLFSPSTLHYAKIASDLEAYFGSLDGFKVVEIGGGYGGQCMVLSRLFSLKNYTLVDLPKCLDLSQKYLADLGISNVEFLPIDHIAKVQECDVVFSYFSFSELDRSLQMDYFKKLVGSAKRGYLICAPAHWKEIPYSSYDYIRIKPLSQEAMVNALIKKGKKVEVFNEDPPTGKGHFILAWRTDESA